MGRLPPVAKITRILSLSEPSANHRTDKLSYALGDGPPGELGIWTRRSKQRGKAVALPENPPEECTVIVPEELLALLLRDALRSKGIVGRVGTGRVGRGSI